MLIIFDIDTKDTSEEARKRNAQLLCDLTMLLVPGAIEDIKKHKLPSLYQAGIKYQRQNPKACAFRSPSDVIARRGGDCKQLVLYRLAELAIAGEKATPRVMWLVNRAGLQAHILIRRADNSLEDPSVNLGMMPPNPTPKRRPL